MGGGSSKSKSNINIVNESIINAVVSAAQNCSAQLTAQQVVEHSGFGFFTGAKQNVSISVSCLQKVVVDDQLIAQMAQDIIQNVSANNGKLFGGEASSEANQNVHNYLSTRINTEFIQNCVSSVVAQQKVKYGGIQIATFDSQTVEQFQNCMMNALNINKIAQGITTDTGQDASAENTGLSLGLGDLFGSIGGIPSILIIIIVIIVAYYLYSAYSERQEYSKETNVREITPEETSARSQ